MSRKLRKAERELLQRVEGEGRPPFISPDMLPEDEVPVEEEPEMATFDPTEKRWTAFAAAALEALGGELYEASKHARGLTDTDLVRITSLASKIADMMMEERKRRLP